MNYIYNRGEVDRKSKDIWKPFLQLPANHYFYEKAVCSMLLHREHLQEWLNAR